MKRAIVFGIVAAAAAMAGCSEARSENGGPVVDRTYQVAGFDRIALAGAYNTTVRTGASRSGDSSEGATPGAHRGSLAVCDSSGFGRRPRAPRRFAARSLFTTRAEPFRRVGCGRGRPGRLHEHARGGCER